MLGLFGFSNDVLKAWQIENESGPERGLFANARNVNVFLHSAIQGFAPHINWESEDMDILSAPIGPKVCCEFWIQQKHSDKLPSLLKKNAFLEDSQSSFLIVRYCVGFCKMV